MTETVLAWHGGSAWLVSTLVTAAWHGVPGKHALSEPLCLCKFARTQNRGACTFASQPHFHHLPPPLSHHQAMAKGKSKIQVAERPQR